MSQHGSLGIFGDQDDAGSGLTGGGLDFHFDAEVLHILQEEVSEGIAADLAGECSLASEIGDADDRISGGTTGTAGNGSSVELREDLYLGRIIDEGHDPFFVGEFGENLILHAGLHVDQSRSHTVDVVTHSIPSNTGGLAAETDSPMLFEPDASPSDA